MLTPMPLPPLYATLRAFPSRNVALTPFVEPMTPHRLAHTHRLTPLPFRILHDVPIPSLLSYGIPSRNDLPATRYVVLID